MKLKDLLGKKLKDDAVLGFFDDYDVEDVVYDFDRLHENMEDVYWAPSHTAGFQMRFNQGQVLDTIFCHVVEKEGFSPISQALIGAPVYRTFDEAEEACRKTGTAYSISDASKSPKFHKRWLRMESPEAWVHYEFKDGVISLVTLSVPES